jgi:ABC-type Fe3+/spermidine/putrescine transport system ATPase subunit
VAGDACKVVIRTTEVKLSHDGFPAGTDNVLEGTMTSREYRGGLTDHRIQIGSKELVVTSHKLCPMIRINGDGGKTYVSIDRSSISVIVTP